MVIWTTWEEQNQCNGRGVWWPSESRKVGMLGNEWEVKKTHQESSENNDERKRETQGYENHEVGWWVYDDGVWGVVEGVENASIPLCQGDMWLGLFDLWRFRWCGNQNLIWETKRVGESVIWCPVQSATLSLDSASSVTRRRILNCSSKWTLGYCITLPREAIHDAHSK